MQVMPLKRSQWLNVLWGIFTLSFWLGKSSPYEPGYGWYVNMARREISRAYVASKKTPVVVIGHSAGEPTELSRCLAQNLEQEDGLGEQFSEMERGGMRRRRRR